MYSRSRRRPPLKSLTAIDYRQFSASENQESDSMLIMSPTSRSVETNKQTILISDLNSRKDKSAKCDVMGVKTSNVSAFDEGGMPEPQVTLGSEPEPSS